MKIQIIWYAVYFAMVIGVWLLTSVVVFGGTFDDNIFGALGFGVFATGITIWQTEHRRPRHGARES